MHLFRSLLKYLCILGICFLINMAVVIMTIRFGLFPRLKVLLVTSSMTTLSHQYIAKIVAQNDEIIKILELNKVEHVAENSNKSEININLDRDNEPEHIEDETGCLDSRRKRKAKVIDTIDMVDISGDGYKGYMLIITNPKRIVLGVTSTLGRMGTKLNALIKESNGIGGINAGGFADAGGVGNGGTPTGLVVHEGKVLFTDIGNGPHNVIGFDEDGVLMLGSYTIDQIKKLNIKEAVSFYPYLIINGKPATIYGDGGWGINPRTAIGQKEDGTVLMLVIDGRQVSSIGTSIKEVQRLLLDYGAVNAANLDGGSSTVMYYKDKMINKPCSPYGERPLPTAFIIKNNSEE